MPILLRDIATFFAILRRMGLAIIWHSLIYRLRYAIWQSRYPMPEGPTEPQHLGRVQGYAQLTGTPGIDLRCLRGTLRIEFVAEGIARVRISHSGHFPALHSYALAEDFVPSARGTLAISGTASKGLTIRHSGLTFRVAADPCRLTCHGPGGELLFEDAGGAGWQGGGVVCTHRLAPDQAFHGLGEKASGLDHRGKRLVMWNADQSGYSRGTDPIYQSIPFLVSRRGSTACGLLFDNTYRSEFDLGRSDPQTLRYQAEGGEFCLYVVAGPSLPQVLARYGELTGHFALPPRWALGFQQSRWSYDTADEVRAVARELRTRRIPCDAIYFDIDYMDGYRVFTWDRRRFPDPAGLIAELRGQGLRAVAILDPGVKNDRNFAVRRDGLARNAFLRLPGGRLLAGPVWPGVCLFPDFSNADVRRWWGDLYQGLLDAGVAGFWNDMNEPAVFFGRTLPYAAQHRADAGPTDHRELHNVYGQLMARAGHEGLLRLRPDERPLLISRAAYAGIQRYACTWTGDNMSTWDHLRLSIPMVLNMGLSGQVLVGPDTGGFSGNADGELVTRWTQLSAFLPYFRNHTAIGTRHQEVWAFGEPWESICRRYIELRYRLLPYTYTAFWQAAEQGLPVARPLALAFPADAQAAAIDDQFMFGDALLVAPITTAGATSRSVYLPRGGWYDFWTGERFTGPATIEVQAPLDHLPLYAAAGSVVPVGALIQHTGDLQAAGRVALHVFAGNGESAFYEDDGLSFAYRQGQARVTRFGAQLANTHLTLARATEGRYAAGVSGYDLVLRGSTAAPQTTLVDGRRTTGWQTDPDWPAPRLALNEFTRVEIDL